MAREHETRDWEFSFSVMVLVSRIFGTVFPFYPKGECMIPLSWALNWNKVCRQTNAGHIQLYCTINEGQVNLLLGNPHVSVLDSRFEVCTSTRTEGFPWVTNGILCW